MNLGGCSSPLSVAVLKHCEQKQQGEKKGLLHLTLPVNCPSLGKSEREPEAGTGAETTDEYDLLFCSPRLMFNRLSQAARPLPGDSTIYSAGSTPLHPSPVKTIPHRLDPRLA